MKRLSVTHSLIQIEPTPIMAAHYPCKLRVCASVRASQCFENICNLFIAGTHNSDPGCEIFVHTVTAALRGYGITRSAMHY